MGPDRQKQFLKKNAEKIPADENVLGVVIGEAKGGAWRRGTAVAVAPLQGIAHDSAETRRAEKHQENAEGDAASWPAASIFWMVLTDKGLHVFEGKMNSQEAGPSSTHYPFDRLAGFNYDKKLLISKLTYSFKDGSSVELDISKQKVQPFMEALARHVPSN
jgi:hypothetical protein